MRSANIIFILSFFSILSCKQQKNVLSNYNKPCYKVEVNYKIIPEVDSTITITYSINSKDLFQENNSNYKTQYYFEIEQYDEEHNKLIHTYNSKIFTTTIESNTIFLVGKLIHPYKLLTNHSLKILLISKNNSILNSYIYYPNSTQNNKENLIYFNSNNENFIWSQPYMYVNETFAIKNKTFDSLETIYVSIDSNQYQSIKNIYSNVITNNFISDTNYSLQIKKKAAIEFHPTCIGNYIFYKDSIYSNPILSIACVSKEFPKNNTAPQMLEALSIIDALLNIDSLKHTSNGCKIELDKIWLGYCTKNEIKAKNNIKIYYNRINEANKRYTIYCEGWYTNRGICYILLGEPYNIEYSNNKEIWYYDSDTNNIDKRFTFILSNNSKIGDYILQKNESTQLYLEQAAMNWNNGIIFTLNKN